jgi:zinc transporter
VLLPINLLTGIFGMNLHGMPWAGNDHGFALVMGVILLGVGLAIYFLRQRDVS